MEYLLEMIRQKLGEPGSRGRRFSSRQMAYHRLNPPKWLLEEVDEKRRDPGKKPRRLAQFYQERRFLLAFGRVCWGKLVQANSALFDPDRSGDFPGDVIFSLNGYFDESLGELSQLGTELFGLKGTSPDNVAHKKIADLLADEHTDFYYHEIPGEFTRGHRVFLSSIMLHRQHLPVPHLASTWFPLLSCKERCEHVMVVPPVYWPDELIDLWT